MNPHAELARIYEDLSRKAASDAERLTVKSSSPFSWKGEGLEVQSLRASHFLKGALGDQRVTTAKTPYANIVMRTGTDQPLDVLMGEFEATWERIRKAGDEGIEWMVEVQVHVSRQQRNRVLGIAVFTPGVKAPDFSLSMRSRHLENMTERRLARSTCAWRFQRFFSEPDERFNDRDIESAAKDKNVTVDGAIRLIRDAATFADTTMAVTGDPYIRVGLDTACGIVLRRSYLEQELAQALLRSWLYDLAEFTAGDGRYRDWNEKERRYVYVGHRRREADDRPTVNQLLHAMGRGAS